MQRITIIGSSGSGKTTLAQQLAQRLAMPCIEFDALYWGPNWRAISAEQFRATASATLAVEQWVADGNYSPIRDIIWQRADTLLWLDYALSVIFVRLLRRTLQRVVTRQTLWAGNRETFRESFLSKESVLYFTLRTHSQRRQRFAKALQQPEFAHLNVLRFSAPQATEAWLQTV